MHYIREETLRLFVLCRIFNVTVMFIDNADDFRRVVQKQHFDETEKAAKKRRKELEQDGNAQTIERQRKSKTA